MSLVLERSEKQVWLVELDQSATFSLPFPAEPYVCMVWANRSGVALEERESLADALIATGCRYIVCGGADCEKWHDSADDAYLARDPECKNDNTFVMTTWHENESQEDVVFFFLTCTGVENATLNRYLIVQVGRDERHASLLSSLVS